jgi:adenylate cyclase
MLLISLLIAALLLFERNFGLLQPLELIGYLLVIACLAGGAAGVFSGSGQRKYRASRELAELPGVQVSPAVATQIWQHRAELLSGGALKPQRLTATVMFVDLEGFTRETERRAAESLLDWLNPFLGIATDTILEHGGMVDDCFGDGIKASFGVPLKRTTDEQIAADAADAVRCARTLARRLAAATPDGETPYVVRFGIHTGEVIACTVGSGARSKYLTIGDAVNVAARLQLTARDLDLAEVPTRNRIVASDVTAGLVGNGDTWHKLGAIRLKGRTERVHAHVLHLEDLEWHIGDKASQPRGSRP